VACRSPSDRVDFTVSVFDEPSMSAKGTMKRRTARRRNLRPDGEFKPVWLRRSAGAALLAGFCGSGLAQDMIQPTLTLPSQAAAEQMLTHQDRSGLFKLAMFDFFPSAMASVYYDDNVNISHTDPQHDLVWNLAPSILATATDGAPGEGKSFQIAYTPTFVLYTDHTNPNEVNQAVNVGGLWPFAKLTLGFSQAFTYSTGPVVDIGGRSRQMSFLTALTSHYVLGEKTSLDANLGLNISDNSNSGYSSSSDWSNQDWFNYQVDPKLNLGLGLVLGYLNVQSISGQPDAPDQNYEQVRARAVFAAAEKLSLSASIGGEWRQYRSDVPNTVDPVWDLAATYRPWDRTSITLNTYQRFNSSALYGDQNYLSTGVGFSVTQQFLKKLGLTASGTFYHADYQATQLGVVADRVDNVYQFRAVLNYQIRERWSASVFYAFESDQSNLDTYTFTRNQVGLQTAWMF
jgi:hypothetical protein